MNQYGTGQNVPYSGQQEADLVNNPRYTGQSAGTNPLGHDGRGPAEESRYGATPLSTSSIAPQAGGHDVWPSPAAPPHAYRSDRAGLDEYGNPRREGVVDRVKDAVGVGPHSAGATTGHGMTPGYDNYGNPRREGVVDKVKDAAGVGPHSGAATGYGTPGYDNYGNNPAHHGTGLGHQPHGATGYDQSGLGTGFGTDPHHDGVHVVHGNIPVAAMGERRVEPGYDASKGQFGHNHQGTLTGSPRKEGIVEKIKDAVGMGKHDNVAHAHPGTTTTTGTGLPGTHGTGSEHGLLNHGNTTTPGSYSHNHMVDTGLGHERHPGSSTGYPHESVGVGQTDAYPHETMGDRVKDAVGVGPHHGTDYERTGKGFEDSTGVMHDSGYDATRTGTGYDATRTGTGYDATRTGTGYDASRTGTGYDDSHNDATAYGIDGAPPKKGMMAKIKEKLHH